MAQNQPNAPASIPRKGPWSHRFLVLMFSGILTMLVYWLLGFALRDIGSFPGPDWQKIEAQHLDAATVAKQQDLAKQLKATQREIKNQGTRQSILRSTISNAQTTIGQLEGLQRLAIEKETQLPLSEQTALNDARALFLESQKRNQTLNDAVAELKETEIELEDEKRVIDEALAAQRQSAQDEYQTLNRNHNLLVATFKLLFLVPVTIAITWVFRKRRNTVYKPLIYATGIAVYWKLGQVMHEYFPSKLFKYVLIFVALAIVLKALVYLLRQIVAPKRDWLLKQYREAYEKFLCPICGYPIRRGPLKYLFWTSRSIKKLVVPQVTEQSEDEAYTCPVCSTTLYEPCTDCTKIRPALLPACDHCGTEKDFAVSIPTE